MLKELKNLKKNSERKSRENRKRRTRNRKKKAIAKLTKKHLLFQKKYRYHIFRKC